MENKCFLTQIDEVIENSNAEYLGGLVFDLVPNVGGIKTTLVGMGQSKPTKFKIVGNGNFLNDNGTILGKEINTTNGFIVSDDTNKVLCIDKYSITNYRGEDKGSKKKVALLNIRDFMFSPLRQLVSIDIKGDLSLLPVTIERLELGTSGSDANNRSFYGDLTHILENDSVSDTSVFVVYGDSYKNTSFDISKISKNKQDKLLSIVLENIDLSGDISNLDFKKIRTFETYSTVVKGNIKCFNNSTVTLIVSLLGELTGDLSLLPSSCKEVVLSSKSNLTYTTTNPNRTQMILARFVSMDTQSIDKYLIDMSSLEKPVGTQNRIVITGTRTSASDVAVNTLISKGITVTIN